jgi:hypothetical protein
MPGARTRNLAANSRVTLNFDGNGRGRRHRDHRRRGRRRPGRAGADRDDVYLEKYAGDIERIGMTPEAFAQRYSEPVRIRFHARARALVSTRPGWARPRGCWDRC